MHVSIIHILYFGVTKKKSAVRKNQHSEKKAKRSAITSRPPLLPPASAQSQKRFPRLFLAVVVARAMAGLVAVEVAVAGGAMAVAIALVVAVAVAVVVARDQ